jgi:hypothetical protein
MRLAPPIACALVLAAPLAAHAELYRWVDDRGVVNYSNIRPEGVRRVTQIEADSRVSTIPAPPQPDLQRQRELWLEARVDRLERELNAFAPLAAAPPVVVVVPAASAFAPAFGSTFWWSSPAFVQPFPVRAVFARHPHFPVRTHFPAHASLPVRHAPVRGFRR